MTDLPGRTPTVIVADGYPSARAAIRRYLEAFGFDVLEALTARELAGLMSTAQPAVVIADTRLPGLAGDELLAGRIERCRRNDRIPVIVTRSAPDDLVSAPAFGDPADNLAKPFNLHTMVAAVRRALRIAS